MKKGKDTTLYAQLLAAKEEEEKVISHRIGIEKEIFEMHRAELQKTEGQETIENFGYKITINQPMTYQLDNEKYRELAKALPEELQCHRIKIELDKKLFDHVKNDKKFGKKIMDCVSVKPGKVSVKVEKIEEE